MEFELICSPLHLFHEIVLGEYEFQDRSYSSFTLSSPCGNQIVNTRSPSFSRQVTVADRNINRVTFVLGRLFFILVDFCGKIQLVVQSGPECKLYMFLTDWAVSSSCFIIAHGYAELYYSRRCQPKKLTHNVK